LYQPLHAFDGSMQAVNGSFNPCDASPHPFNEPLLGCNDSMQDLNGPFHPCGDPSSALMARLTPVSSHDAGAIVRRKPFPEHRTPSTAPSTLP
jgi:hypothetical protein